MPLTRAVQDCVKRSIDRYARVSAGPADKVQPGEFMGFVLALLCLTGGESKYVNSSFTGAMFGLKRDLVSSKLAPFVSEINFFYSNGQYLSEDVETAYTDLQNAGLISFINPEFKEFTSKFEIEQANKYLDHFYRRCGCAKLSDGETKEIVTSFLVHYGTAG